MPSFLPEGTSSLWRGSSFAKRDEIFGMDTDEALAYSTSKMVWVRDRWVGAFYYSLVFLVLVYILGVQILWNNEHFLLKDVNGLTRLWYSHPTLKNCDPLMEGCASDFASFKDLPYCEAYSGPIQSDQRSHCEYQGVLSSVPGGVVQSRLFIPTAVEFITEVKQCEQSESNNYNCPDAYVVANGTDCLHGKYACKNRGGKTNQFFYVADVKNFKVRLTSSFDRDGIRGNSLMLPAYVGVCDATKREGNRTKTWSERKFTTKHTKCEDSELRLEKISCEFGVNCAEMKDFDILEDTGINVAGRDLTGKLNRITDELKNEMLKEKAEKEKAAAKQPGPTLSQLGRRSGARRGLRKGDKPGDQGVGQVALGTDGGENKAGESGVGQAARGADGGKKKEHDPVAQWYSAKKEYSDNWGDIFTIGRLLQLAGADLDLDRNMDGWTTRQAGTALEVVIVYNNLYPILSTFGYTPVQYHYKVNELILPYVSRAELSKFQPPDYPETRVSEVQYGVLIHFKVGGAFGFFSMVYFILMLTAAFALTATATTITDLFFMYVSGQRDNFFHLKYEVSPDFSEMWECKKCGYLNLSEHDSCRGVPKYMCPRTTPHCGAPRQKEEEEASKPEAKQEEEASKPEAAAA